MGVNQLLRPVVGPLGRVVECGRNWEGFSTGPYLSCALAYETVQGVQSTGVGTPTKATDYPLHPVPMLLTNTVLHANEQETNRNPEEVDEETIEAVSQLSMIRRGMSCTSGHSRMSSLLAVHL